jgi:formylglycine-generating enzyme required for sulfatase activity
MKPCLKNLFLLPALIAGLGLMLAGQVTAQTSDGMALIPAGAFTMGDTLDGESDAIPTVSVTVSGFYMDTNLVSYSQWQTVYNWATSHGYVFDNPGSGEAANHPVQSVNWYDSVKWCNARSQQAGLTPVYYTDAGLTQVYISGDTDAVYPNWAANGYRLPTEAECKKAARGGLNGLRFPWGNTIDWNHANYYSQWTNGAPIYSYDLAFTSGYDPAFTNGVTAYTSPVGYFAPNGYGLYDMAGNVQVWCWDWYAGPPYPAGSPYLGGTDPHGPASSPDGYRLLHGGFFTYGLRCAKRSTDSPSFLINHNGLRCVRGAIANAVAGDHDFIAQRNKRRGLQPDSRSSRGADTLHLDKQFRRIASRIDAGDQRCDFRYTDDQRDFQFHREGDRRLVLDRDPGAGANGVWSPQCCLDSTDK